MRISDEASVKTVFSNTQDPSKRAAQLKWGERLLKGAPFAERVEDGVRVYHQFYNVSLCRCYTCDELSVWVGHALAWPELGDGPFPNPDLPTSVKLDFEEAAKILNLSPRGAAALLRLAIQKLCAEIGGRGKNIDQDIAALVKQGLDVRVQRALDIVRVIGNEAVHPGQIDLRDDVQTAEKLFSLVNLIADTMISQPKHIDALYSALPQEKLDAIARRDGIKSDPKIE